jgi:hypothetical protein
MNKLTQTLLTGAALCALGAAPAIARPTHPAMHVTALHAGHVVNKTKLHVPGAQHVTYTYGVYSSASASSVDQDLWGTYYKWIITVSGYMTLCSNPKQKVKTPKKTVYGSTKADTETYSFGCPSGPTVLYGDSWTNKTGVHGNVDKFRSSLIGHWKGADGAKYKGTLNLDVQVSIFG